MHRVSKWAVVGALGVGVLALSACSAGGSGAGTSKAASPVKHRGSAPSASRPITSTAAAPAAISIAPLTGAKDADPADPAKITVANGTLTTVKMISSSGRTIPGRLAATAATWTSTEQLGYGRTYSITAVARNGDGSTVTKKARFSTTNPAQQTTPVINTLDDYYKINKGQEYGVAMVPDIDFGATVANKKAAEDAVRVTTTPHVTGAFYWTTGANGDEVHWRPQNYWAPGTKVTISADEYGVKLGSGLYGGSNVSTSFRIGPKDLTVADDTATNQNNPKTKDKVRVYHSGKLVRTMDTSMGKHGGETVGGKYINFYTLAGNYTVLDHENPAIMSSQSYGLPANAPSGYGKLSVPYSTKISNDGIYLHEFNDTIFDQENGNDVSEGCLNLKTADAAWYFNQSRVGDPVVVHGAKGAPTIQEWEGGDWSVPWSTWSKGGDISS